MSTNTRFFFAKHVLVARAMASDTERSPKRTVNDDVLLEHNKCASELLDDVHLREMSIRGLEDGSHMETKKDKIAKDNNATPQSFLWPPNLGQLSLFRFLPCLSGGQRCLVTLLDHSAQVVPQV